MPFHPLLIIISIPLPTTILHPLTIPYSTLPSHIKTPPENTPNPSAQRIILHSSPLHSNHTSFISPSSPSNHPPPSPPTLALCVSLSVKSGTMLYVQVVYLDKVTQNQPGRGQCFINLLLIILNPSTIVKNVLQCNKKNIFSKD